MAENKQYITQNQENGCVMISEDVVATIVVNALTEIEGFAGLSTKPGTDIMDMIGKKNWGKGVKVTITEDNTLLIDCNLTVVYGTSVVEVAKAAQDAIGNAVEAMTGIAIEEINVNICGIVRQ